MSSGDTVKVISGVWAGELGRVIEVMAYSIRMELLRYKMIIFIPITTIEVVSVRPGS